MKFKLMVACLAMLFVSGFALAKDQEWDVLFYIRNPWAMATGSESPDLVAYKTGKIIWKEKEAPYGYQYVVLNDVDYEKFKSKLKHYDMLRDYYDLLRDWSDVPSQDFYFNISGIRKHVNVYGPLDDYEVRFKAPGVLRDIYDFLSEYKNAKSKPWRPDFIEVIVWPYEYAPEKSSIWPKGWPDLESKSTRKGEKHYSIYMPIENEKELYRFIEGINPKGAVEINGRKWIVATRIPFSFDYKK